MKIKSEEWKEIFISAQRHGIAAIVLDGINKYYKQGVPLNIDFQTKMDWIGYVQQIEQTNETHIYAIRDLGKLLKSQGYRMMVLKGYGLAYNYPIPNHRQMGDLDMWCFGKEKNVDKLLESKGIEVDRSHHHHTVFIYKNVAVENHFDFINVYTRPSAKRIEIKLKELASKGYSENGGLYYPSADFNALFLLRHCASHFSPTELTIRQALDWGLFMEKHHHEISWDWYLPYIKQEGMYRFYNLLGLFCVKELGFEESIFHILHDDSLYGRFRGEIIMPEFQVRESGSLLKALLIKPARWWHNRWKNRLCYPDSLFFTFMYGVWGKIIKPVHFVQ